MNTSALGLPLAAACYRSSHASSKNHRDILIIYIEFPECSSSSLLSRFPKLAAESEIQIPVVADRECLAMRVVAPKSHSIRNCSRTDLISIIRSHHHA